VSDRKLKMWVLGALLRRRVGRSQVKDWEMACCRFERGKGLAIHKPTEVDKEPRLLVSRRDCWWKRVGGVRSARLSWFRDATKTVECEGCVSFVRGMCDHSRPGDSETRRWGEDGGCWGVETGKPTFRGVIERGFLGLSHHFRRSGRRWAAKRAARLSRW